MDDHLCLVSLMTDPTARWNSSHCTPAGDAVEDVGFDGGAFGEAVEPGAREWSCMRETAQSRHSVREQEHLAQARSYLDSRACAKQI